MASTGVIGCSCVTQQGVARHWIGLRLLHGLTLTTLYIESTRSMDPQPNGSFEHHFRERFESLLPSIRERWPDLAQHTLEATRGSIDEVARLIEQNTGLTSEGVREQLEELMHSAEASGRQLADSLDPLEQQLEQLLDELNTTLRPRIERPVRQRPLLAIGVALGIGVVLGSMLSGGRGSR